MDKKTADLLVSAMADDGRKAFDTLFMQLYPKVKYFITGLCHDEDEAEDACQDIFMQLWIRRSQLAEIDDLSAYIFTIAHNEAIRIVKKSLRIQPIDATLTSRTGRAELLEEQVDCQLLEQKIMAEVSKMSEQKRKVFLMSRAENLTNQQIADRLGISRRTVETHISAALKDLRRMLPLMIVLCFISSF